MWDIFKPNDWMLVHSENAIYEVWTTIYGVKINNSEREKTAFYNIYFSKSRNKYKLKQEGYIPNHNDNDAYIKALEKLAKLNSKL